MADSDNTMHLPSSAEHRNIAAAQFERANQVDSKGDYDYAIRLLLSCCKLDPPNLIYRQTLRRIEKKKYKNNLRGAPLASMSNMATKAKIKSAKRARDYLKVLELGELVLARNPWDVSTQMDMAEAADALGHLDFAIWTLEQARQKDANDTTLNRALARLYEKRGNFTHAIGLWELVRKAIPTDVEAQHKAKDLAANETIMRGNYEDVVSAGTEPASDTEEDAGEEAAAEEEKPIASKAEVSFADQRLLREIAPLKARIEQNPTQVSAYLQLAQIYRRADRFEHAREILEQGLGPTGNNFELMIELTDLEIEPFRRNLTMADEKLKTAAGDDELRKIRIRLLKEINTRELDLFRQKSDRFPTDMNYRFELGVRLLRAGQLDEAIRELQATRSDPRNHWRSLLYLGYCFKQRNNWRLAQRNFEEALAALPPAEDAARKEILFQLAQGCADAGDLQKAIDLGTDLANLDFGYRDIGKLLDEWQERLQQADV